MWVEPLLPGLGSGEHQSLGDRSGLEEAWAETVSVSVCGGKGPLRFEFAGAHWSIYCKNITTLPEEAKIVNKVYVVRAACRLEPGVQT